MNCPFCNYKVKCLSTYFFDIGPYPIKIKYPQDKCETWICFEKNKKDKKDLLWYAILEGNQYTQGHTLFIPGPFNEESHITYIFDKEGLAKKDYLKPIILGINKLSIILKEKLVPKPDNIHVLSLCEGQKHLHFHLIPRYKYRRDEIKFFSSNYLIRDIFKKKLSNFRKKIPNEIHGMWYSAYQEMNFVFSEYFLKSPEERAAILEKLAESLRPDDLKDEKPWE